MSKENLKDFIKLAAYGSIQLDLKLSISKNDAEKHNLDIEKINTLKDIEKLLISQGIKEKIELLTDSFFLNCLLFLNKTTKRKVFTECIPIQKIVFEGENGFFKEIFKYIADKNYLYFVDKDTTFTYDNDLTFIIFIDDLSKSIKFGNTEKIKQPEENLEIKEGQGDDKDISLTKQEESNNPSDIIHKLFNSLAYPFETREYFFIDITFILKLSVKDALQVLSLIEDLASASTVKIIVAYPSIISNIQNVNFEIWPVISEILAFTDIYIFERKEAGAFFDILNELMDEGVKITDDFQKKPEMQFIKITKKKKKDLKIGLFLDDFKTLTLIEQHSQTNMVLCHTDYEFDFFENKQKSKPKNGDESYKKLVGINFKYFKGVYFGTFLTNYFQKKTFNSAHQAGIKMVLKILEYMAKGVELPSVPEFYYVSVKSSKIEVEAGKEVLTNKREASFVLDCVNVNNSKMGSYNPLHDNNLKIYFNSQQNRKHLKKMGFINKKGDINPDPDFRFLGGPLKNKELKNQLEYNQSKLINLKEKNNKFQGNMSEFHLMKLPELNSLKQDDIIKLSADFGEKQKNLKLPSIEQRWKNHPLLMKNIAGNRPLSLDIAKHSKIRPNNDNSYEHLSKVISKRSNNSLLKQKVQNILAKSATKRQPTTSAKKKTNIKNSLSIQSSYNEMVKEIDIEYNKYYNNNNKDDKKKNNIDGKIKYQKKNNVIINRKPDKTNNEVEEILFDTEVDEEKINKVVEKEGNDENQQNL